MLFEHFKFDSSDLRIRVLTCFANVHNLNAPINEESGEDADIRSNTGKAGEGMRTEPAFRMCALCIRDVPVSALQHR